MIHHYFFTATPDEPTPSLRLYDDGTPVLSFGAQFTSTDIHLSAIEDLPTWLREFAGRLTDFAELVEVRAMGAAS